ncbi:hypothetical protein TSOC_000139 [Tetrabaena socialis]|uniref:TFIIS N-terminal domain-containing protein n=1 Tax=Tetrabaena socialis TaxID=47790 RepID=A0A2J8AK62_9CHLO|nr:hypothetical protein TSOC_000139 [Tetrabaena socialis]|eukprot:PNH12909.1 hypothetical protein TSOC_000139 [Tetrabaena socialis]
MAATGAYDYLPADGIVDVAVQLCPHTEALEQLVQSGKSGADHGALDPDHSSLSDGLHQPRQPALRAKLLQHQKRAKQRQHLMLDSSPAHFLLPHELQQEAQEAAHGQGDVNGEPLGACQLVGAAVGQPVHLTTPAARRDRDGCTHVPLRMMASLAIVDPSGAARAGAEAGGRAHAAPLAAPGEGWAARQQAEARQRRQQLQGAEAMAVEQSEPAPGGASPPRTLWPQTRSQGAAAAAASGAALNHLTLDAGGRTDAPHSLQPHGVHGLGGRDWGAPSPVHSLQRRSHPSPSATTRGPVLGASALSAELEFLQLPAPAPARGQQQQHHQQQELLGRPPRSRTHLEEGAAAAAGEAAAASGDEQRMEEGGGEEEEEDDAGMLIDVGAADREGEGALLPTPERPRGGSGGGGGADGAGWDALRGLGGSGGGVGGRGAAGVAASLAALWSDRAEGDQAMRDRTVGGGGGGLPRVTADGAEAGAGAHWQQRPRQQLPGGGGAAGAAGAAGSGEGDEGFEADDEADATRRADRARTAFRLGGATTPALADLDLLVAAPSRPAPPPGHHAASPFSCAPDPHHDPHRPPEAPRTPLASFSFGTDPPDPLLTELLQLKCSLRRAVQGRNAAAVGLILSLLAALPLTPRLLADSQVAALVAPLQAHSNAKVTAAARHILDAWKALLKAAARRPAPPHGAAALAAGPPPAPGGGGGPQGLLPAPPLQPHSHSLPHAAPPPYGARAAMLLPGRGHGDTRRDPGGGGGGGSVDVYMREKAEQRRYALSLARSQSDVLADRVAGALSLGSLHGDAGALPQHPRPGSGSMAAGAAEGQAGRRTPPGQRQEQGAPWHHSGGAEGGGGGGAAAGAGAGAGAAGGRRAGASTPESRTVTEAEGHSSGADTNDDGADTAGGGGGGGGAGVPAGGSSVAGNGGIGPLGGMLSCSPLVTQAAAAARPGLVAAPRLEAAGLPTLGGGGGGGPGAAAQALAGLAAVQCSSGAGAGAGVDPMEEAEPGGVALAGPGAGQSCVGGGAGGCGPGRAGAAVVPQGWRHTAGSSAGSPPGAGLHAGALNHPAGSGGRAGDGVAAPGLPPLPLPLPLAPPGLAGGAGAGAAVLLPPPPPPLLPGRKRKGDRERGMSRRRVSHPSKRAAASGVAGQYTVARPVLPTFPLASDAADDLQQLPLHGAASSLKAPARGSLLGLPLNKRQRQYSSSTPSVQQHGAVDRAVDRSGGHHSNAGKVRRMSLLLSGLDLRGGQADAGGQARGEEAMAAMEAEVGSEGGDGDADMGSQEGEEGAMITSSDEGGGAAMTAAAAAPREGGGGGGGVGQPGIGSGMAVEEPVMRSVGRDGGPAVGPAVERRGMGAAAQQAVSGGPGAPRSGASSDSFGLGLAVGGVGSSVAPSSRAAPAAGAMQLQQLGPPAADACNGSRSPLRTVPFMAR